MEPKKKQNPVVDVTGDRRKVWWCKEQYYIGSWNFRSMNPGKLEMAKQEMARVNIDILGISELKCNRMGEFNSDDHYIYYCGQESLRRNGVASSSIKESEMQYLDTISTNTFPRQTIQYHSNPSLCPNQWCWRSWSWLVLWRPTRPKTNTQKDVLFIIGDWNTKVGSQETPGVTGKFGLEIRKEAGQKLITFCQENTLIITNSPFQQCKRRLHMDITRLSIPKSDWLYSFQPKIEQLYTVSKNETGNWLWLRSWIPY